MARDYKCGSCGKRGVKLWHPEGELEPLICATCAEKRQSQILYNEYSWNRNKLEGHLVGKKVLPKWKVNNEGKVPSYAGFDPFGKPYGYTTTLLLGSEKTSYIPSTIKNVDWDSLPTR